MTPQDAREANRLSVAAYRDREALDRITALCDEIAEHPSRVLREFIGEVRAVLAEVSPESGGELQTRSKPGLELQLGGVLDRDTLMEAFRFMPEEYRAPATDWVLALVRPVAGVTLTPEQARRAAGWYFQQADDIVPDDADRALVARLEAAS